MSMFETKWKEKAAQIVAYMKQDLEKEESAYSTVYHAMNYSVQGGGKRIRPVLLMACYEMFADQTETILPFCAAMEYIHTYSLIHDDLPCMDDDDLRRGNPTCHIQFGEAMAVLAGDGLLNRAYEKIFSSDHPKAMEAGKKISYYAGCEGMIGGQVIDMESENKTISLDTLQQLQRMKTGALLAAACGAGAVLGGASADHVQCLEEFGFLLGLAFQIQDDILDVTATSAELGKPTGSDEKNQKTTYVSLLGLEECHNLNRQLTQKAIETLKPFGEKAIFLKDMCCWLSDRKQ